jgi:peptidoglycan-associated lipoprotein
MPSPPKSATAPLEKLAHWLAEHPDVSVVLDGHADSKGSEDENLWLSRQRAANVKSALERAGAPRARLTTRAFGSFWPADEAPPDASWNRRVVVQTKGESCPRETEEVVGP